MGERSPSIQRRGEALKDLFSLYAPDDVKSMAGACEQALAH
jgi:hypothetical protein